jgi:hypothetical protein
VLPPVAMAATSSAQERGNRDKKEWLCLNPASITRFTAH